MNDKLSKQQASCMDEYDPNSLTADQAWQKIQQSVRPLQDSETIAIDQALDRVLAQNIISPINVPAHTNSAMDGYAINGNDIPGDGSAKLRLVATVLAGQPTDIPVTAGECARIMTGGKMPQGADTVIMQEHVQTEGEHIIIGTQHQSGQNVRQAGEDIAKSQQVLSRGRRLSAADIGMLASLGIANIKVFRKPKVAIFSTGDELRSIGEPLAEGQIYDSNRYTLHCMLQRTGVDIIDLGVVRDDRQNTTEAVANAAQQSDMVITTGGVSVGSADYVKDALEAQGSINFWKIAIKPGRPLAFGQIKDSYFFGLPGNPVSAMVTFYQFVIPALNALSGCEPTPRLLQQAKLLDPLRKRSGRMEFQRGILSQDDTGALVVRTTGGQGSGILSSMSKANCFIILPLECEDVAAGSTVQVQSFAGLI